MTMGESGQGGDCDDKEEGGGEDDPWEEGYADTVSVATEAHVSDGHVRWQYLMGSSAGGASASSVGGISSKAEKQFEDARTPEERP